MAITFFSNITFSYPKGIILGEQDFQTFLKVLESGKNGACLKKVQKNTYSAYLNDGARLLFVEDETSLKLIAKFSSHDEYMEKLKQKGLASRYLKDLDRKEFDLVFSNIPHPDYTLSSEEHKALLAKVDFTQKLPKGLYCTLEGKNVELNEKQKSLSHVPKPELQKSYTLMQTGGPGTGKTVSLMSQFEEAYGSVNQIAAGPETKHSSEEIQQFIYLTTTPQLAEKVTNHITQIIPNKILPCMSHSYQNFAAMVDPTIPSVYLSQEDIEDAIASGQKKYKRLKTEKDFITWCKEHKVKPEDYLESSAEEHTDFYKKLYQEFRILSAYPKLEDYQTLGILESLFTNDKELKKSLFELYSQYTKDFVDLNFYDLGPAIASYKKQYPHLIPNLFLDEAQNLSRIQFLNLKTYAIHPEKMIISLDPRQSVYDPISNLKFITRCFEANKVTILPIDLDHSYRVPLSVSTLLQQLDNLEKEHTGGRTESKNNAEIYATNPNKPGKLVVIYDASPDKEKLLEECKQLCKRPNCLVIVGDPALLTEAKAALADSENDTTLFFTSDKSIGLEFEHVILYKPWAGFTEAELQSLMASVEKISTSKGNVNKPKDKHDKTKHAPLPKLHQLLVSASRPLESLRIIPGVELKLALTENQPKTRAQKKQAKAKIPTIAVLTEYLLQTSTLSSTHCVADNKPIRSEAQIHQEWIDTCWQLIVNEKDYDEAQRICEQKQIKAEELNLLDGLRTQIPLKFHATFFKPVQSNIKQEEPQKQTKMSRENYIKHFLENVTKKNAQHLFARKYETIESILFDPNKEGNNLWEMLVKEKKLWTVIKAIEDDISAAQKFSLMLGKHPKADIISRTVMLMNNFNELRISMLFNSPVKIVKAVLFESLVENDPVFFQTLGEKEKELLMFILKEHPKDYLLRFLEACESSALTKKMSSDFICNLSYSFKTKKMDSEDLHISLLQTACAWGSTTAAMVLGYYCKLGNYVNKDLVLANQYFLTASQNGDKEALLQLADSYDKGEGVKQDYLIASKLRSLAELEQKIAAEKLTEIFPELCTDLSQTPTIMSETKTDQREQLTLPQKQKTKKEKYIESFVKGFSETDVSVLFAQDVKKIESIVFKPNENGETLLSLLMQVQKLHLFLAVVLNNAGFHSKWCVILPNYKDAQNILIACRLLNNNCSAETMKYLFRETSNFLHAMLFESYKIDNKVLWEMLPENAKKPFFNMLSDENHPQYLQAFISCMAHSSKAKELGAEFLCDIGLTFSKQNNIIKTMLFYQFAINMGNALACGLLGRLYDNDLNYPLALECYVKGHTRSDAFSQYELGLRHKNGSGVVINIQMAINMFELASKGGSREALKTLAECYENGEGVFLNTKMAQLLYKFSKLDISEAKKSFNLIYPIQKSKLEDMPYTPAQESILTFLNNYHDQTKTTDWVNELFLESIAKIKKYLFEIELDSRNFWTILFDTEKLWSFIITTYQTPKFKEIFSAIIANNLKYRRTVKALTLVHNFTEGSVSATFNKPEYIKTLLFECPVSKDLNVWEKLSNTDKTLLFTMLISNDHSNYLDNFMSAIIGSPKIEALTFDFLELLVNFYLKEYQTNPIHMQNVDQLISILCSAKMKFIEDKVRQDCSPVFMAASKAGSNAAIHALGKISELGLGKKQYADFAKLLFDLYALNLKPIDAARQFELIERQMISVKFSADTDLQQTSRTEETKKVPPLKTQLKSKAS